MSALLTRRAENVQLVRPRPQRIVPPHFGKPKILDIGRGESLKLNTSLWPEQVDTQSAENALMVHLIPSGDSPPVIELEHEPPSLMPLTKNNREMLPQKLIRPIALKVARPIPKSAVEAFYEESYRHGIQAEHVHQATALAQDWHRKWTQQDEEGHTMPEPEAVSDPFQVKVEKWEDPANYDPRQRYSGAKNPSPEESREDPYSERKRLRVAVSGSVSSLSPDSGEDNQEFLSANLVRTSYEPPNSRRRVIGFDGNFVEDDSPLEYSQQYLPAAVGLLRPVALRVQRPQAIDVSRALEILANTQQFINDTVPAQIKDLRSQHSTLSPLTLPSVSSSYQKPKPAVIEEDEMMTSSKCIPSEISHVSKRKGHVRSSEVEAARNGVLHRLAVTGGNVVGDAEFQQHLDVLDKYFQSLDVDTRYCTESNSTLEGKWLTLTKPTYFGNLGNNDDGDPMYTLGRMSFDMFSPTRLVCSLQGNFNFIEQVSDEERSDMLNSVPKALQEEVESGDTILRTYNIVTALTIEPHLAAWPQAPNKDVRRPIRGIMTTTGYILPDPDTPNRNSVWITGGRIEPNDDVVDQQEWIRQFGKNPPKHGLVEQAKLLAVKLLMGATVPDHMAEDGTMDYTFQRPLGGHGLAYVDTLYVDESLRIVKGHRGTIFVFFKLPAEGSRAFEST
ncbi:hypothetical protein ACA910_000848 [Epithemia clementina (nom. ined.)]